jgi:hypothetical protein
MEEREFTFLNQFLKKIESNHAHRRDLRGGGGDLRRRENGDREGGLKAGGLGEG